MEFLIAGLLFVIIVLLGVLLYNILGRKAEGSDQASLLVQQQLDALRLELNQGLKNSADSLSNSLKSTQDALYQSLKLTTDAVGQQLSGVTQQMHNNSGDMSNRLDTAAHVIREIKGQLGELGEATKDIKTLGEMLRAPKFRGGLGELLLEDLLKQVLPSGSFHTQYAFKNGQTVDAIIQTGGGKVPVDSKFPLENFRKMVDAKVEQEKKVAYRAFVSDVKKHIDAIAEKYIVPDEGTFDFALMYIPAENIYYETIIKDELFGEDNGLYSYATNKHVVPVSPNSFYAHLRVIALGLKGLQIERSAKEIIQSLSRLNSELQKFTDVFETLGKHLNNAKNNYDEADKKLNAFSERLKNVQSLPAGDGAKQIDAFSKS